MRRIQLALLSWCVVLALGAASASAASQVASALAGDAHRNETHLTVKQAMASYGVLGLKRLQPQLTAAGFPYMPPDRLMLLAFKQERKLEVWGEGFGRWRRIAIFPILAASGGPGPKLHEGDRQVPEGIYPITGFNPNSRYHLALLIGYPNRADIRQAAIDGRTDLGGEIMIHGSAVSAGCLAMGDSVVEEIFALVDEVGLANTEILIAPHDLRRYPSVADSRPWVLARYARMAKVLQTFTTP